MITIKTQFKFLYAILPFASIDEARYILNGIRLEVKGNALQIIATDGRHLAVYQDGEAKLTDAPDGWGCIIPSHLIELLATVEMDQDALDEEGQSLWSDEITITVDGKTVWLDCWRGKIAGELIEGKFPSWRQVMPEEENKPIQNAFGPALLGSFIEAAERLELDDPHMSISSGGDRRPLVIRFGKHVPFVGVLMPLQNVDQSSYVTSIPEWAR